MFMEKGNTHDEVIGNDIEDEDEALIKVGYGNLISLNSISLET